MAFFGNGIAVASVDLVSKDFTSGTAEKGNLMAAIFAVLPRELESIQSSSTTEKSTIKRYDLNGIHKFFEIVSLDSTSNQSTSTAGNDKIQDLISSY